MAQDDKVKLKLLVDMVKALEEYVRYLAYFIPNARDTAVISPNNIAKINVLTAKIKEIKDKIE